MLNKLNEKREARKEAAAAKKENKKARKLNKGSNLAIKNLGGSIKHAAKNIGTEIAADVAGVTMMCAGSTAVASITSAALCGGVTGYYSAKGVPVEVKKHRWSKGQMMNSKELDTKKKYHSIELRDWWNRPENEKKVDAICNGIAVTSVAGGAAAGLATRKLVKTGLNATVIIDPSVTITNEEFVDDAFDIVDDMADGLLGGEA